MKRSYFEKLRGSYSPAAIACSVILLFYCLITLLLIPNLVLSSFKTKSDLIHNTVGFPRSFTIDHYAVLFREDNFLLYFRNSIFLSVTAISSLLFISSLTAYGLSRFRFKGRNLLQTFFLLGMMFPVQLGILPIFIILRTFGLLNNLLGMVLIYSANLSLPVFIFSRFFRTLPYAIYESAKIDGAGEFRIYATIMVPLSKPVFATVGIINFVFIWNDFFMPLVFLTRKNVLTITLGIYRYMNNFLANWHLVFAAVTIALVPVLIMFMIFSNQLITGLTAGSIKE